MKLKSLLLGSAAALVAVSGARAADAIIAEPEPVEYVRVCDAYGAGFFYIPGTETCLKFSGYARYQININKGGWTKAATAELNIEARSDTEWGPLVGFMRFGGTAGGSAENNLKKAYLSIGGLKMGYDDNAFDGDIAGENDSLGGATVNLVSYTFAANGFDATISLDDDGNGDFTPNVSGNIGGSMGPVGVRLFAAYDNNAQGWAIKGRVTADVTEGGKLSLAAVYGDKVTYVWNKSQWSIAGSYSQKVTDTVSVTVGAQYFQNAAVGATPAIGSAWGTADYWTIGANVDWTPVTNFLVRANVGYNDSTKATTGYLRFQRSF